MPFPQRTTVRAVCLLSRLPYAEWENTLTLLSGSKIRSALLLMRWERLKLRVSEYLPFYSYKNTSFLLSVKKAPTLSAGADVFMRTKTTVPYVGIIQIRFKGRNCNSLSARSRAPLLYRCKNRIGSVWQTQYITHLRRCQCCFWDTIVMYMSKYPFCNIQVQTRIKCTVKPNKLEWKEQNEYE